MGRAMWNMLVITAKKMKRKISIEELKSSLALVLCGERRWREKPLKKNLSLLYPLFCLVNS